MTPAVSPTAWRPVYDAHETIEQFAARQRAAFAAFELAWREGRVSLKLKGYYDQLVRDVGANAYAWWSEERWAAVFSVSRSTIKRVLARLTKAGLIRRERRYGASSRTYLTVYDVAATTEESDSDNQHDPSHNSVSAPIIVRQDVGEHEGAGSEMDLPTTVVDKADYRQPDDPFCGTSSELTIGSLLAPDSVKNRHLTFGAAGSTHISGLSADPTTQAVLEREGVSTFVVAPQLAQRPAGEVQAVSRYLDTQQSVRDRPRLFAWLVAHGFGRQLLAGRGKRPPPVARDRRRVPLVTPATPTITPPPERPPTVHAALWDRVCTHLRTTDPPADLADWLSDLVLLEVTASSAVIGTPNVFVREAMQVHAALLATALGQVTGHARDVLVVIGR